MLIQTIARLAKSFANRFSAAIILVGVSAPIEPLMGASFVVNSTADSGAGSLRQAILDANATAGEDLIHFEIPPPGPYTIILTSALPDITDELTIDGTTQAGFVGKPI